MVQSVNTPGDVTTPHPNRDDDATIVVGEQRQLPSIDGYDIKQHIGAGGMADVWLGEDHNLKRHAAVKTMSSELVTDPEFIQRFAEEAQIVAGFRHPNIVTVFASGQSSEHYWIAMEFISGGTLSDKIAQGPMGVESALPIAAAMADALAYSHKQGIIHRDFKPGNVLFTDDGSPVLSDFGIAKSTEVAEGDGLTVPGLVIGSPRYMAPEQLLGKHVTAKVDVYALGLVLYEMLCNNVPPPDIAMVKSDKEISALGNALPGNDKVLLSIVADCLREAPDERASAADIAERLRQLIQPPVKKSKTALFAIAATLLVSVVVVVLLRMGDAAAELHVSAQPSDTNIYLNGQLIPQGTTPLGEGAHTLVAVEPGYFGEVVYLQGDEDQAVEFSLTELTAPNFDEFSTFTQLFGGEARLQEAEVVTVAYPVFAKLLKLKSYQQADDQNASDLLVEELNALAAAGDPAAQVTLYVANFDAVISGDRLSGLIQQASNSGYGLATFYQALHYQWAKSNEEGMDLAALQVYRSLMALAAEQGLGFAASYVSQADDLINDG